MATKRPTPSDPDPNDPKAARAAAWERINAPRVAREQAAQAAEQAERGAQQAELLSIVVSLIEDPQALPLALNVAAWLTAGPKLSLQDRFNAFGTPVDGRASPVNATIDRAVQEAGALAGVAALERQLRTLRDEFASRTVLDPVPLAERSETLRKLQGRIESLPGQLAGWRLAQQEASVKMDTIATLVRQYADWFRAGGEVA
jgi:hypothetical protein